MSTRPNGSFARTLVAILVGVAALSRVACGLPVQLPNVAAEPHPAARSAGTNSVSTSSERAPEPPAANTRTRPPSADTAEQRPELDVVAKAGRGKVPWLAPECSNRLQSLRAFCAAGHRWCPATFELAQQRLVQDTALPYTHLRAGDCGSARYFAERSDFYGGATWYFDDQGLIGVVAHSDAIHRVCGSRHYAGIVPKCARRVLHDYRADAGPHPKNLR